MNPDIVNSLFQVIGSLVTWLNVYYLFKHKKASGVYVGAFVFFGLWGFWNLYYYSHLNQSFSYWTGYLSISANLTWVLLYIRYRHNE